MRLLYLVNARKCDNERLLAIKLGGSMKKGSELKIGDTWRLTHTYYKNHHIDYVVRAKPGGGFWFMEKNLGFTKEIEDNKTYPIVENPDSQKEI